MRFLNKFRIRKVYIDVNLLAISIDSIQLNKNARRSWTPLEDSVTFSVKREETVRASITVLQCTTSTDANGQHHDR